MKTDLFYFIKTGKANEKAIAARKITINELATAYNELENYMMWQNNEMLQIQLQIVPEITRLKNQCLALESLLIMHGVTDYQVLMEEGMTSLYNQAQYFNNTNQMQLPALLLDSITHTTKHKLFELLSNPENRV